MISACRNYLFRLGTLLSSWEDKYTLSLFFFNHTSSLVIYMFTHVDHDSTLILYLNYLSKTPHISWFKRKNLYIRTIEEVDSIIEYNSIFYLIWLDLTIKISDIQKNIFNQCKLCRIKGDWMTSLNFVCQKEVPGGATIYLGQDRDIWRPLIHTTVNLTDITRYVSRSKAKQRLHVDDWKWTNEGARNTFAYLKMACGENLWKQTQGVARSSSSYCLENFLGTK